MRVRPANRQLPARLEVRMHLAYSGKCPRIRVFRKEQAGCWWPVAKYFLRTSVHIMHTRYKFFQALCLRLCLSDAWNYRRRRRVNNSNRNSSQYFSYSCFYSLQTINYASHFFRVDRTERACSFSFCAGDPTFVQVKLQALSVRERKRETVCLSVCLMQSETSGAQVASTFTDSYVPGNGCIVSLDSQSFERKNVLAHAYTVCNNNNNEFI